MTAALAVRRPATPLPPILVESVHQATKATFDTICGDASTRTGTDRAAKGGAVIGIISFVGDFRWSVMLGVLRETAAPLALAFIGEDAEFDAPVLGEVVSELTNILAGDIVARLDEIGIRASMSLPTVVRGSDLDVMLPGQAPAITLPFAASCGPFWLKLSQSGPGLTFGRRPGH